MTARTGKPHTKVFKEEHERSIIICVDVNEAMRFGTRGTFKSLQAARAASLLGWQASCGRDKLGACLFGDVPDGMRFFEPSRSRASLWGMFKQLSDRNPIPREQPISLEDVLRHINKASPTWGIGLCDK